MIRILLCIFSTKKKPLSFLITHTLFLHIPQTGASVLPKTCMISSCSPKNRPIRHRHTGDFHASRWFRLLTAPRSIQRMACSCNVYFTYKRCISTWYIALASWRRNAETLLPPLRSTSFRWLASMCWIICWFQRLFRVNWWTGEAWYRDAGTSLQRFVDRFLISDGGLRGFGSYRRCCKKVQWII